MRYVFAALTDADVVRRDGVGTGDVLVTEPAPKVGAVSSRLRSGGSEVSPEQVVARLMSFDSNRDGRVAIDELSERMQGLVARGDRNCRWRARRR